MEAADGLRRVCPRRGDKSSSTDERRQAQIDYYLLRHEHRKGRKPACQEVRLPAVRDADGARPPWTEEGATEAVEHLWRLEKGGATDTRGGVGRSGYEYAVLIFAVVLPG